MKVKGWTVFNEVRIARPEVLPVVLSRTEVQSLLGAITEPRFRACLRLMYHCGLRVGERLFRILKGYRLKAQRLRGNTSYPGSTSIASPHSADEVGASVASI